MEDIIEKLTGSNDRKAYAFSKELAAESAQSDVYCHLLDDFASLLTDDSSYVRTRGFILCLAQAKWAGEERMSEILPSMLTLLHDEKPTAVRQCLGALKNGIADCPFIAGAVIGELDRIDPSVYKDSMAPLIEKDVNALRKEILRLKGEKNE